MKLRFKYQLNKKAYLQIDFSIAIFLFFLFFISFYSFYIDSYDSFDLNYKTSILNSNSNDICKLLISNSGNPINWESDISNLKHIGLLKIGENYLDVNKINNLTSSVYINISNSLNIDNIINIKIINLSNNYIYLNFGGEPTSYLKESSSSVCYSLYDNLYPVKIIVEVWE